MHPIQCRACVITYCTHRSGVGEGLHPYLRRFEACVLEGQAVFRVCHQLREEGWIPNWILNHVGFGNGLYLSDAFPEAKRIGLFEWFYRAVGSDVDFLGQAPVEARSGFTAEDLECSNTS